MVRPWLGMLVLAAACASDPADVAGTYSLVITNGANGCAIANWTPGPINGTTTVVISQNGSAAAADVAGLAGVALDALVGGHVFTGDVDGSGVALAIEGTRGQTQGNCAYTIDAFLDATLSGDNLAGTVEYRARTNGGSDCGALTGCVSHQDFAGARPPQ